MEKHFLEDLSVDNWVETFQQAPADCRSHYDEANHQRAGNWWELVRS